MNWKDLAVHHIGIVVADIEAAKIPYETIFGMQPVKIFDVEAFSAQVAFLPVKNTYVELVQPTNPDDGLGRFLQNGGGLHHICYEVDDMEATVAELNARGVRLVPGEPQWTPCFEKTIFLHPKDTGKVLIELVQTATCPLPAMR